MKEGYYDGGEVFEQVDGLYLAFGGRSPYWCRMATHPILARFNAVWHLCRQHRLTLVGAPACLDRLSPDRPMYDALLALRDFAELAYGQAITSTTIARTSVWRNGFP